MAFASPRKTVFTERLQIFGRICISSSRRRQTLQRTSDGYSRGM